MTLTATFLTLFPESLRSVVDASILGRAQKSGALVVEPIDLRLFSPNKHRTVDDNPCGGGAGMVVRVDVVVPAIRAAIARDVERGAERTRRVVLVEPRGKLFSQADAQRFATYDQLVLVCGRYEGIDARAEAHVDEVLSIGDYVLTGGELAALVILDATARLLPGVLGNADSAVHESHSEPLLEHRQYTRPVEFESVAVPPVLMSGNHRDIERAHRKDALVLTQKLRPDLYARHVLTKSDRKILDDTRVPILDPVRTVLPDLPPESEA
jgi:tRNA (guanine37-N1)-methyltransferase